MNKKTLSEIDAAWLRGRPVVVRADLNVPLVGGEITDDQRIRASLETIRTLADGGARVVLLSHLGRPKGKPNPEFSLAPVAYRLQELLGRPVRFVPHAAGPEAAAAVRQLVDGSVVLLENTRFLEGDTDNDPALATSWAALGELFVNEFNDLLVG